MSSRVIAIDARCIGAKNTGDTSYWTGLVQGLMALDSDLEFLLYSNRPKPATVPDHPRFRWIELHSRRERWWSLFRFPLAARREGARAIHVQYNLSPMVSHGGLTTIHDVSFYRDPSWFRPQDRLFLQRFVPPSARRASRVLTVSEFSKSEIHRFISGLEGKVVVTPNAVAESFKITPRNQAKDLIKSKLGIDRPFLFTLGTRWPRKNLGLAVAAAEGLGASFPHFLVVTGKPGWGEESPNSRTLYTGYLEDETVSALYSAADLYLAPAWYEGFGITLLEAFKSGCPVLASPNGAHEEVSAGAAEIAANFEVATWTQSLARLLADSGKLDSMREAGTKREAMFDWQTTAKLTEQAYREVLG